MERIQKEIEHRKSLLKILSEGGKISKEDREWMQLHVAYSSRYGYPAISGDVIEVKADTKYTVRVNLIESNSSRNISPVFSVPISKGYIFTNDEVTDGNGKISNKRKIKNLSTMNSKEHPICEFTYLSKLGKLSVCYECETTDHRGATYMMSSLFGVDLSMQKEKVADNKIIYSCTDFDDEKFDKYVFAVEWDEKLL